MLDAFKNEQDLYLPASTVALFCLRQQQPTYLRRAEVVMTDLLFDFATARQRLLNEHSCILCCLVLSCFSSALMAESCE